MSMTVFELLGYLKLDKSEFDSGLESAVRGGVVSGKLIADALEAGAKAVIGFAQSSINAGMAFDKAMGGVAATMGNDMAQMEREVGQTTVTLNGEVKEFSGTLREFAMFMGQNTVFSATEAASALNYMALAGYDAQKSMDMLPSVLNMAAAGAMDLARASDMVTDISAAMGMDFHRTELMVDEFAKAASTGNTSVEQLGDAFLRVGGLAKELNGGIVTLTNGEQKATDGTQELEIAFTAMANAGIKGSEAGTHMRNMLLKLSSPTKDGRAALEAMGVTIYDTEGKMRSLSEIFGDLNNVMSQMTQEQRIGIISDLFNTRDVASAEALLAAVEQSWDHIGESILDAKGAASEMAATKLDNLTGDITLFKSALESAQITVSDRITPALREFVQIGTNGISKMTAAFTNGGLDEAMAVVGNVITEMSTKIMDKAPQAVAAGAKLIAAIAKGILQNKKAIAQAVQGVIDTILSELSGELSQNFRVLASYLDYIKMIFDGLFGFIINNSKLVIGAVKSVVAGFLAFKTVITVINGVQTAVAGATAAIALLHNPVIAAAVAVGLLVTAMTALSARKDAVEAAARAEREAFVGLTDAQKEAVDAAKEFHDAMWENRDANAGIVNSIDVQYQAEAALIEELKSIVDANGQVKQGYEERAAVITNQLSEAFGIEIEMQNGVIQKYGEVMAQLDRVIEKKKAEALLSANSDKYAELMGKQVDMYADMTRAANDYSYAVYADQAAQKAYFDLLDKVNADKENSGYVKTEDIDRLKELQTTMVDTHDKAINLREAYRTVSQAFEEGQAFLENYDNLQKATATDAENLDEAITKLAYGIKTNAPVEELQAQFDEALAKYQETLDAFNSGDTHVTEELVQQAHDVMAEASKALVEGKGGIIESGKEIPAGVSEGIEQNLDVATGSAENLANGINNKFDEIEGISSPSEVFRQKGDFIVQGLINGLESKIPTALSTIQKFAEQIANAFTNVVDQAKTWGTDMIGNFIRGIKSQWDNFTSTVGEVAQIVADNIGFSEPKEGVLSNFHTYAPDMMKLFADGIKENAYLVKDAFDESMALSSVNVPSIQTNGNAEIVNLLKEIKDSGTVNVVLEGDADRLFRVMQGKAHDNYRKTGTAWGTA